MKSPLSLLILVCLLTSFSLSAQRAPDPGALATAVAVGDRDEMENLLSRGATPDESDLTGETPLGYALLSGELQLVERLLDVGADPDKAGRAGYTPLMRAVVSGREDFVIRLIASGADPNLVGDIDNRAASPLSLAVNRGDFALARRLVDAGADPRRMVHHASGMNDVLNLPKLDIALDARTWRDIGHLADSAVSPDWNAVSAGDPWRLHRAARSNDWPSARTVLDGRFDPETADERGVTALMTASWHGHASLVSLLLQRGANPLTVDNRGRTALCYAAGAGRDSIVSLILSTPGYSGDNRSLFLESLDQSPLYYALINGQLSTLELLLSAGIPAGFTDAEGTSLLMMAAWFGSLRAVNLLLPEVEGGLRDSSDRTALAWCAAAFDRQRRSGRTVGNDRAGDSLYPIARVLAARVRNPEVYATQPTPDMVVSGIDAAEAWSIGRNPVEAEILRNLEPSPVPMIANDGDLGLYRIFRDEEPGIPDPD